MKQFTHLHVHSEYSLLDGLSKIPKMVKKAKDLGMKHLAITDHGSLYGAIKFYKECKEAEINPIIGCELYISKRSMLEKEIGKDQENYHLTVLAKDYEGYKNLLKIVTLAHLEGFYYRPRIDKETLAKHSKGLMALSGCNSSEFSKALIAKDLENAQKVANVYRQIFGKENYFLEVQKHQFEEFKSAHEKSSEIFADLDRLAKEETLINQGAGKISKKLGIQVVATNDVHYVDEADAQAQDAIVCIQTGKTLAEIKRLRMIDSPTYFLKSAEEMEKLFPENTLSIVNSNKVAQQASVEISLNKVAFPNFQVPSETTPDKYLKKLCQQGLKKKFKNPTQEIKNRMDYELSVIIKKGYSTYFLVVADFVNWSRDKGIISTTRGSASGSLVSYLLGITTVNPLFFKLPFERFLNLYRPTLPDIDVDFADNRRDEVIDYVRNKYGENKVAQIGTFGTMMARAAVRDVARVMGLPYSQADKVAKMIPIGAQGFHMSLDLAKKVNKEFGNLYREDKEVKELIDLAEKVEGNARHVSVHAAGVVISPTQLTDFTALQKETKGEKVITQYDMYDIEEAGLVKMDFLGIRNLAILGQAIQIVKKTKGKEIDLTKISLTDKKAFEILAKGETMGLFQLGGTGMTRYLKELKPTNIFDIMAMISLFRPGPMNSIPEFIQRKHDEKKINFYDERMRSYLKESYGVIVYQDDVLLTAINIAGYNWEEADKFRKAMGKKIPTEMAKQKEKFIKGCIKNGMKQSKAEGLFKLIEPFAAYGFNKAHAASYAVIAYQTAFMKANFPVEFMTAVMSAESDDTDKIAAAVAECSKMKIKVLTPDVNKSDTDFAIEGTGVQQAIRFGLSAIKNVGKAAIEAILNERSDGGFKSIEDFVRRVNLRVVNRKTLESLIKAGAMDLFGNRNAMLKVLDEVKSSGVSLSKTISEGQGLLFEEKDLKQSSANSNSISSILENTKEAPKEEVLAWERELLGLYLTEHPLEKIVDKLESAVSVKIADIEPERFNKQTIKIGGIISAIRKTFTKIRQEEMCFIKIQDMSGSQEVIVFPRAYASAKEILIPDQIVIVAGKLEVDENSSVIIAENISVFDPNSQETSQPTETLEVAIPKDADRILLSKIYQILKSRPGNIPTFLVLPGGNGNTRKVEVPFSSERSFDLEEQLLSLGCTIL